VDIFEVFGGFGLATTNVDYAQRVIGFDNIFGYQINKNFLSGFGAGLNFYNGGIGIPVFIDMRYSLNPRPSGLTPLLWQMEACSFILTSFPLQIFLFTRKSGFKRS